MWNGLVGAVVWGVIGVGVLAGLVVALARLVRQDGWGHRPPPRSRADWAAGTTLDTRSSVQAGL